MEAISTLYDYLVEGPKMGRDDEFIRINRVKPRRNRATSGSSTPKPGGIRQRRGKRCIW